MRRECAVGVPESELQVLTGRLAGFEDVIGREPRPVALPQQRKQVRIHGSDVWNDRRVYEQLLPTFLGALRRVQPLEPSGTLTEKKKKS